MKNTTNIFFCHIVKINCAWGRGAMPRALAEWVQQNRANKKPSQKKEEGKKRFNPLQDFMIHTLCLNHAFVTLYVECVLSR